MVLANVSPSLTANDAANVGLTRPPSKGDGLLTVAVFVREANGLHCGLSQQFRAGAFAPCLASLLITVSNVVSRRAEKQMGWLDTKGRIATMANLHPLRDGAVSELPRKARREKVVNAQFGVVHAQPSVAGVIYHPHPQATTRIGYGTDSRRKLLGKVAHDVAAGLSASSLPSLPVFQAQATSDGFPVAINGAQHGKLYHGKGA